MNLLSYWKLRHLKSGITICVTPSYRCNQNCSYCIVKNGGPKFPKDKCIKSAIEWLDYVDNFPEKVGEVIISGGEPTLYYDLIELVNGLLKRGLFVNVYSNLTNPTPFESIIKTRRFLITATYHKGQIEEYTFEQNALQIKHELKINEFISRKLKKSHLIRFWTNDEVKNIISCLRIGTDGTIFTNCFDQNQYYLT